MLQLQNPISPLLTVAQLATKEKSINCIILIIMNRMPSCTELSIYHFIFEFQIHKGLPDVEKIISLVFGVTQFHVSQSQNSQIPELGQGAVLSVFQSIP